MVNGGFFSRADYNFLSKSRVNWDMDLVKKSYKWVEKWIVFRPKLSLWQAALREAMLEAGIEPDNGFTLNHRVGTKVSGSTFDEVDRRHGAAELLSKGNLKNLRIVVLATVQRIIFSKEFSTIGVTYSDTKGITHKAFIKRNKGEIILSAGAIGSPQLLLLSGIGDSSYLSSKLIMPLIKHNPNVGQFMADNPRNGFGIVAPFPIPRSTVQVVGITHDYYVESLSIMVQNVSVGGITFKAPGPLSFGSLELNSSTSAKIPPRVRFNYYTNPKDLARCVKGVRRIGKMLNTVSMDRFKHDVGGGLKGFVFAFSPLPANQSNDLLMEEYCRSMVATIYHYHGGCVVGKVVDGDFRVFGVNSLRVVDGSIFNASPGTNPQATVMMMGRYIGLKMLGERRSTRKA